MVTPARHSVKTILTVAIVIAVAVAGLLFFRGADFSFLRRFTARSLVYIVPLFVLYQSAALSAHVLLLRDMGHPVSVGRLAAIMFASFSSSVSAKTREGTPAMIYLVRQVSGVPISIGASAMAVLYCVEIVITVILVIAGFSYFVPEATFRNLAWLGVTGALIVALSISFHLSRRKEMRATRAGRRLADFVAQVRGGMGQTSVITLAGLTGLALAKRVTLACTSYLILKELGDFLPLKGLIFLQSSAILVGFASMIPLGLGTRDLTAFFLYGRLGLRPELSVAMAAIERVIWTFGPFCLGLICAAFTGVSRRLRTGSEEGRYS